MTNKEKVIRFIREMPDGVTFDEIVEQVSMFASILRGEQAADEGRLVPHSKVKEIVAAWISKDS